MYKVKIFFGSFYGEECDNAIGQDVDWTGISVAASMVEVELPIVPSHGEIVEIKSLRSQIYSGWKKYVDNEHGYLAEIIQMMRDKYDIPQHLSNAEIFKEMVFGGEHLFSFAEYGTYVVGNEETSGVWFTPNKEYIKIELYT